MAEESDDNGDASWYRGTYPSHAEGSSVRLPPPRTTPTPRYGYDYRRPMMLSPEHNVIDLTEEPESPQRNPQPVPRIRRRFRFPGDIMNGDSSNHTPVIDLEADENDPVESSSSSADVEIVGSSTVSLGPVEPRYFDANGLAMHYPPPTRPRPRPRPRDSGHGRRGTAPGIPGSGFSDDFISFMTSMPGMLQYSTSAFSYNSPTQPAPRPRRNSYKAPVPAAEGFTRCLEDENVPVCPHCEEELGVGEGRKQEIYIAKPCGHVSIVELPSQALTLFTSDVETNAS